MRLQLAMSRGDRKDMQSIRYWSCLLLFIFSLQGCGTIKSWFSDEEDNPREPAELTKISSSVAIKKIWSVSVGMDKVRVYIESNHLFLITLFTWHQMMARLRQ